MTKQLKLTDEVKSQLAGLLPMSKGSTYDYTPKVFDSVDEEYRPVFIIKQLSTDQVNTIKEMLVKESMKTKKKSASVTVADLQSTNKIYMEIAMSILVDWRNLYDLGTQELLDYSEEAKECLPDSILTDIFSESMKITGFLPHGIM